MQNTIEILFRPLRAVITVLVAVMAGIVAVNLSSRYLFHLSLSWSAALARYLMVWAAFLGAAVLVKDKGHLKVDLWQNRLSAGARSIHQRAVLGLSLLFFCAVTVFGFRLVLQSSGQVASSITWLPMGVVYSVIPLSGLLMVLATVLRFRNPPGDGDS